MSKPHNIASFVLRFTQELWQDTQGEPHVRWRGHIRHVQGDQENRFTDFAEAVTFMQQYLTQLTMDTLGGKDSMSQEKAFEESFKFWDQFSASYTKMMSSAMEQSVKQSQVFQDQVEETREKMLGAWQFPFQPNQSELLETLNKMQTQMEVLANKVDELERKLGQENSKS